MNQNTIHAAPVTDFLKMIESFGISLEEKNIGIVNMKPSNTDISIVPENDFFKFIKDLNIKQEDIAVINIDTLMSLNSESKQPVNKNIVDRINRMKK